MNNNVKKLLKKYDTPSNQRKWAKERQSNNIDLREFGFTSNSRARPDLNLVPHKTAAQVLGTYRQEKKIYDEKAFKNARKVIEEGILLDDEEVEIEQKVAKRRLKKHVIREENDEIYYAKLDILQINNRHLIPANEYVEDVRTIPLYEIRLQYESIEQLLKEKRFENNDLLEYSAEEGEESENSKSEIDDLFGSDGSDGPEILENEEPVENLAEGDWVLDQEDKDLQSELIKIKRGIQQIEDELDEEAALVLKQTSELDESLSQEQVKVIEKIQKIKRFKVIYQKASKRRFHPKRKKWNILKLVKQLHENLNLEYPQIQLVADKDSAVQDQIEVINLYLNGNLTLIENYLRKRKRKQGQH